MLNLNGAVKAVNQLMAVNGNRADPLEWWQGKLVDLYIWLSKNNVSLTNEEFTRLTGLALPIRMTPSWEVKDWLIDWAAQFPPTDGDTPADLVLYYYHYKGLQKEVNAIVDKMNRTDMLEFSAKVQDVRKTKRPLYNPADPGGPLPRFSLKAEALEFIHAGDPLASWMIDLLEKVDNDNHT